MNILNNSGPNIEPWGIPRKNFRQVAVCGTYSYIYAFSN